VLEAAQRFYDPVQARTEIEAEHRVGGRKRRTWSGMIRAKDPYLPQMHRTPCIYERSSMRGVSRIHSLVRKVGMVAARAV
jgi:hypothetical protein